MCPSVCVCAFSLPFLRIIGINTLSTQIESYKTKNTTKNMHRIAQSDKRAKILKETKEEGGEGERRECGCYVRVWDCRHENVCICE